MLLTHKTCVYIFGLFRNNNDILARFSRKFQTSRLILSTDNQSQTRPVEIYYKLRLICRVKPLIISWVVGIRYHFRDVTFLWNENNIQPYWKLTSMGKKKWVEISKSHGKKSRWQRAILGKDKWMKLQNAQYFSEILLVNK